MTTGISSTNLLVVSGELSGDRAAARVVAEIQKTKEFSFFGIGGDYLKQTNVELLAHIGRLASLGLAETFLRVGRWARVWADLREQIERRKPALALLVDAPELNLPLARILVKNGTKVIYYIGPQVWAWRQKRLGLLRERTDAVALVLPFEKELYSKEGVTAEYVGHPIVDEARATRTGEIREWLNNNLENQVVALLPGFRHGEIKRHVPAMTGLCKKLLKIGKVPVFAPPPGFQNDVLFRDARRMGASILPEGFAIRDLLRASDAALVASGTATLEAALELVPMAILYKLDTASYMVAKRLLKIPYVGLPNWIAGRKIVPEILQNDVSADALFSVTEKILLPDEQKRQKARLKEVVAALGPPGVSGRVARMVLERLP